MKAPIQRNVCLKYSDRFSARAKIWLLERYHESTVFFQCTVELAFNKSAVISMCLELFCWWGSSGTRLAGTARFWRDRWQFFPTHNYETPAVLWPFKTDSQTSTSCSIRHIWAAFNWEILKMPQNIFFFFFTYILRIF